jgi:hypothetical protein
VTKAWTGSSDSGSAIEAYAKTAFDYFGTKGQSKSFKLFRPVLNVTGSLKYLSGLDIDFADSDIIGTAAYNASSSGLWDTAVWDSGYWGGSYFVSKEWQTPLSWTGYCAAGKIKIATNTIGVQWPSIDYIYEVGSGL